MSRSTQETELYHYGVLGMKWGKRKANGSGKRKRIPDSEDSKTTKKILKKKVSQMSNNELKTANQRLQLERQHRDLTKKTNVGKKAVDSFIKTAGVITAVAGAAAVYGKIGGKIGGKIIDKIGDSMPSVRF